MKFDLKSFKEKLIAFAKSKSLYVYLSTIALAVVLFVSGVLLFGTVFGNANLPASSSGTDVDAQTVDVSSISTLDGKEMRGVWVASVANLNYPSKPGLSKAQLEAELDDIVKTAKEANLNAIFFQVRPASDALYPSEIFPWSEYLTGTQGKAPEGDFDSLAYIIEKAHESGIELHAWINPYRVTSGTTAKPKHSTSELAQNNPARLHPEYCVAYADGKLYYNPGVKEVIDLTVSGVRELVKNYPTLDGIHFDDYFYPYPVSGATFDDAAQYEASGKTLSLDNWRRENVNSLVSATYAAIKEINPECSFGISPFGIYANKGSKTPVTGSETSGLEAYSSLYCDAVAWANGGYVDYLAPQIYWAHNTSAAPFDTVARWWNAVLDGTGVDLYVGHAIYKVEDYPENEIPIQIEFSRNLMSYKGSILYGYAWLKTNTLELKDKITQLYSVPVVYAPVEKTGETPAINYPYNGYSTSSQTLYYLGSSDPAYPVYFNGEKISRTKDGYFSLYTSLKSGQNTLELTQNGNVLKHSVTKINYSSASSDKTMSKMDILDTYPNSEIWISGGDTVNFSCIAPAGSNVTVTVGGAKQTLKAVSKASENGKYIKQEYTGSIKFSSLAKEGEIIDLGNLTFSATLGGESATKRVGMVKQIGKGAQIYAEVISDYTYLKKAPDSSFYDDYLPTSAGMRDYIVGYKDGYYKLKFGGYVSVSDVSFVSGQPLLSNRLTSVALESFKNENSYNYTGNTTDIRFGVLENVPCDVKVNGAEVKITLFCTDPSYIPKAQMRENSLFESISGKKNSDTSVVYTAKLKNADNFYGFRLVYENSMLTLKFNNPISLCEGDKPLYGKTILVDAGHGGNDIGARGPSSVDFGMYENGLNLAIANEIAAQLSKLGATVVTTRTEDVTVDIYDRLDLISEVVPDLLVSIHHNSVLDSVNAIKARGYLGLYSNNSGILLAKTVSDSICKNLNRYQRATSYQKLAMVRDHRFPSTLCEMSFISNIEEFQWTVSKGNIERSASAVVTGILEFYEKQVQYENEQ